MIRLGLWGPLYSQYSKDPPQKKKKKKKEVYVIFLRPYIKEYFEGFYWDYYGDHPLSHSSLSTSKSRISRWSILATASTVIPSSK